MKKYFYTIGREETSDILLWDDLCSREHATIRIDEDNNYFITDHSSNGTYVQGMRLEMDVEYPIRRGTYVEFAHVEVLDWSQIKPIRKSYKKLILRIALGVFSTLLLIGVCYCLALCFSSIRDEYMAKASHIQDGEEYSLVTTDSLKQDSIQHPMDSSKVTTLEKLSTESSSSRNVKKTASDETTVSTPKKTKAKPEKKEINTPVEVQETFDEVQNPEGRDEEQDSNQTDLLF